jgi:hypothetical protein
MAAGNLGTYLRTGVVRRGRGSDRSRGDLFEDVLAI